MMLECRDLSVFYGFHQALDGISINIEEGEIVTILGANGAGKSTILKAVAGMIDFDDDDDYEDHYVNYKNEIIMEGSSIFDWDPHEVVELGLSLVPEGRKLFGELTVIENLLLGAYPQRARSEQTANLDRVLTVFPQLSTRRDQITRTMSGGEQQMVAVGRSMMSSPKILMLDEPSLGLSPLLSEDLFRALLEIRDSGVAILLVEQNAKQSLAIADRGYLLENGRITGADSAEGLSKDQIVMRAYLGAGVRQVEKNIHRDNTRHSATTASDFKTNIQELVKRAEQRQIFDLRGEPAEKLKSNRDTGSN
jgi:branched-chain amino acid transport system ATP-binding protein